MKKWGVLAGMIFTLVVVGSVKASEGTVDLFNTVGEPSRCWAASILTTSYNYKVIVSCRGLIYPAVDASVFTYTMWDIPTNGQPPEKLGNLGVGKAEFSTNNQFSGLIVTKEGPSQGFSFGGVKMGQIVMRGTVQPIDFLNENNPPTPTPTPAVLLAQPSGAASNSNSAVAKLSSSLQLGSAVLRIVGIAFLLGIVAIGIVIVASSLGGKKNVPPGL